MQIFFNIVSKINKYFDTVGKIIAYVLITATSLKIFLLVHIIIIFTLYKLLYLLALLFKNNNLF